MNEKDGGDLVWEDALPVLADGIFGAVRGGDILDEDCVVGGVGGGAVTAAVATVEGEMEDDVEADEDCDAVLDGEQEPESPRVRAGNVGEGELVNAERAGWVIGVERLVFCGVVHWE